jgi:hypothetical protein
MIKETSTQIQIVKYLNSKKLLFTATLNGVRIQGNFKYLLKKFGVLKGISDLLLFESAQDYHGMFVEVKTKTGKQSKDQKDVAQRFRDKGWYTCIVRSVKDMIKELENYYDLY